jgi:hypothetical protein
MDPREQIQALAEDEIVEIRKAAAWYAKYHARIIAERADDQSAMAVAQRDRYLTLITGLRKMGVRVVDPTAPVSSLSQRPPETSASPTQQAA